MTNEQATAYYELVQAIVSAVPELRNPAFSEELLSRPITLEDVILAAADILPGMDNKAWADCIYEIVRRWYLGKPLSKQSDETKLWLHSLLIP